MPAMHRKGKHSPAHAEKLPEGLYALQGVGAGVCSASVRLKLESGNIGQRNRRKCTLISMLQHKRTLHKAGEK